MSDQNDSFLGVYCFSDRTIRIDAETTREDLLLIIRSMIEDRAHTRTDINQIYLQGTRQMGQASMGQCYDQHHAFRGRIIP